MYKYKKVYPKKKGKSIFKRPLFWIGIIFLIAILAAGGVLIFSPFFQVSEIQISGNVKLSADDLKTSIGPLLQRNFYVLASQSIALVDTTRIHRALVQSFPQIAQVGITRKFPSTLLITIHERTPIATWCQDAQCFFIDRNGIAFEKTEASQGVVRSEIQQTAAALGSAIFAPGTMNSLDAIQKAFNSDMKIPLQEILVSSDESKFTAKTIEGWQAYFNDRANISDQVFNLNVILKEKIPQTKRGNLEYIDLRFGNKVYYKYR